MKSTKDVTQYSNNELYEVLNHIDRSKYPERVIELENEIDKRKANGSIPKHLVPEINWSEVHFEKTAIRFFGILILGTTFLSLFQFLELFTQETKAPLLLYSGFNTILLFFGSISLLANKPGFGIFAIPPYLIQTFTVYFSGLQNSLILGLSAHISIGSNGLTFGFSFGSTESIFAFESINYFEIGINFYALIFSALLIVLAIKKKE